MLELSLHRAVAVLAAVVVTATLGEVVPCPGSGAACVSAARTLAAPGSGTVMAAATGPACPRTASAQAAALQPTDGDAAPASSGWRLRLESAEKAGDRPLLLDPVPHSHLDGTDVYLVVSSLLI